MRYYFLTALLMATSLATTARAETHEVLMLNRGQYGAMVYEPDFLRINPGDTVVFRATHPSHNAATIQEMLPLGAEKQLGKINEEIEMTLTQSGTYGIKCSPHYSMGMVMLIEVGTGQPAADGLPDSLPEAASQRFQDILQRSEGL